MSQAWAALGVFCRVWFVYGLSSALFLAAIAIPNSIFDGEMKRLLGRLAAAIIGLTLLLLYRGALSTKRVEVLPRSLVAVSIGSLELVGVCFAGDLILAHLAAPPKLFGESMMDRSTTGWAIDGIVSLAIIPPLEEVLYRGLLYTSLRTLLSPSTAIILSSLAFGLDHPGSAFSVLSATWFGAAMAYGFERSGSIEAPIVAHGLYNLWFFLIRLYLATSWQG